MPLISLDNAGRLGMIEDLSLDSLPVEAWNVMLNVRVRGMTLQNFGANSEVYNAPAGTEAPIFMFNVVKPGDFHWLVGTTGKIFKVTASAHTDMSKVATTYGGGADSIWCGFDFHRHQIMNIDTGSDLPQVLVPGTSNFVDLTNWPASTYCKFMNAYKGFLIAYNITESGANYPARIKWSDKADPGSLPGSWDETNLTILAGESDQLEQGGGKILCARVLNDVNFIYKDKGIWYMIPRNDLRVFDIKEFEEGQGILAAHACTTYKRRHFLVVQGDVVVNDGRRLTSIIESRNRNWLFDNLHKDYYGRMQVVPNHREGEIWVCFADQTSTGRLNCALVYNVERDTWAKRVLADYSCLAAGVIDTSGVSQLIDDDTGIINDDNSIIDAVEYNPTVSYLMAGDADNTKYYQVDSLEDGVLGGGRFERHGLTIVGRDRFGEWKHSANSLKQITRLYPKFSGAGTFNVYAGYSRSIDGAITWVGPEVFTVGGVPHVDFFNVVGEVMALRFEPTGTEAWKYSGCDLEINVVSENTV